VHLVGDITIKIIDEFFVNGNELSGCRQEGSAVTVCLRIRVGSQQELWSVKLQVFNFVTPRAFRKR
jgi:hypothetical protein